jgi:hypothetical protein
MLGTAEHAVLTMVAALLHALEYLHVLGKVSSRRRRLLDHRRTGPEDLEELNLLLEQVPLATRFPLLLSLAAGKRASIGTAGARHSRRNDVQTVQLRVQATLASLARSALPSQDTTWRRYAS